MRTQITRNLVAFVALLCPFSQHHLPFNAKCWHHSLALTRFINGSRKVNVSTRLEKVCQGKGVKHKSMDALDEMYLKILESSMDGDFSKNTSYWLEVVSLI